MSAPTGQPEPVARERIRVTASSTLAPSGSITYGPENLLDDDGQTAWNSDAPATDGRGEILTFRFAEPVDLQAIAFVNGYAKDPSIFSANHRVQEFEVRTDAGVYRVELQDTSEPQRIEADFGFTSKVVLEVVDIHPGDGNFDNPDLEADLAVTEIDFIARQYGSP